ncbi:MAG: NupC/NupG family nucleoside CNT transporter [Bdellovibrionales bacterium]|nr:NupC/NupG family nucleoside CNT transporter [Bdellovibrionales bacterium]
MRLISFLGLFVLIFVAYLLSENKKAIKFKPVLIACLLQITLGVLVLGIPSIGFNGPLRPLFSAINQAFVALLSFTNEGSQFLFGPLVDVKKSGFIIGLQILPVILFFSSLISILYYLGVIQKMVKWIAIIMQKTMGTSGAESLSAAANIFAGQTEAPLIIKPYIDKMTRSELNALMVGGMATVAGGILAVYVGLLISSIPDIAGHLITASVMSAPAALAIAKIMVPETKTPETLGKFPETFKSSDSNIIEAASNGASEGLKLAFNVAAMLLVFIALIALCNSMLTTVGQWANFQDWGKSFVPTSLLQNGQAQLSLQVILSWVFAPFAFIMGIPWSEAFLAGSLLGEKVVLNEFISYLHLSKMTSELSERTVIILSYALSGFANFASIGIQIGGIGGIAPRRKSDLAKLGIKALIGGSLAAFMTACIAGFLI